MAFAEAFETIRAAFKNPKGKAVDGHLAVEIVLTDEENAGIGYLEVADHQVRVEPYDYWGHEARLIGRSADLAALFAGKLDWDTALREEKLFIEGDSDRAALVRMLIRKPAGRKPAANNADTKKATDTPKAMDAPKKSTKRRPAAKETTAVTTPTQEG